MDQPIGISTAQFAALAELANLLRDRAQDSESRGNPVTAEHLRHRALGVEDAVTCLSFGPDWRRKAAQGPVIGCSTC
ncbi:MAG: hypothetical protein ACREX8_02040 [Gammaproteobacteria bacterium]